MGELLAAAFKTGVGSAASLLLGVIATKIMAIVLGPSGMGLFALLRQVQQTAVTLGTVNGQTALVQGLASREGQAKARYLGTVMCVLLATGGLTGLVFLVGAPQITYLVFAQSDATAVVMVRWLALPVFLAIAVNFLSGVLNGYRAIGRLALVQVASATTMALLAYPVARLVKNGQPHAFAWLMSASACAASGVAFFYAYRQGWLSPLMHGLLSSFERESARRFFSVAGTLLITGLAGTGTQLAVRSLVVRQSGLYGTGILDVAWTLSMMYVTLILASFGTYYLPTLSHTIDPSARIELIQRLLRFSILLMVPLVVTVIVLKPLVISFFYSGEFMPSLAVMRWMLIGDYFKVVSWVLAMPMLAYADMKVFFWVEIVWNVTFLVLSAFVVSGMHWLPGIGVSFMLLYLGYLAYALYYTGRRHHLVLGKDRVAQWAVGLALVIGASVCTWNETQVRWLVAALWMVAALAFSGLTLNRDERQQILGLIKSKPM